MPGTALSGRMSRNFFRDRRVVIFLGLAPAVGTLLFLFVGPLLVALVQSLGHAPIYRVHRFPTLEFHRQVLFSTRFRIAAVVTLYYALVPTFLATLLGVALAVTFSRRVRGKRFLSFFFRLPLVVPYLVGAAMVVALFANGGLIARLLYAAGLIESTGQFPRILFSAGGWGIMLVYLFKQVPFTFIIVTAVLSGVGPEYEEAARTLGASRMQAFRFVLLPRIMPGVVTSSLLVFAFNFQSYEIPYLLGATFPATLPVEALRRFNVPDLTRRPEAMAYVVAITVISGIVLFAYLRLYRRWERSRGGVG
ncbi:MAG: ABC transporter permease subunit [Spirochaetaceae bacterium]|nr:MAG: ABC transporter permease subunit [Spirochaetaceae bacterium]